MTMVLKNRGARACVVDVFPSVDHLGIPIHSSVNTSIP